MAKYFAIIPAMFAGVLPALGALNIMGLESPCSAILSAVIFNALVIVALVPLALRGVKFVALTSTEILKRNLLVYGIGGLIVPPSSRSSSSTSSSRRWGSSDASPIRSRCHRHSGVHCDHAPVQRRHDARRPGALRRQVGWLLRPGCAGPGGRVEAHRPGFQQAEVRPPPAGCRRLCVGPRLYSDGSNYGTSNETLLKDVDESRVRAFRKENRLGPNVPVPVDAVTSSGSGLDPHITLANAKLRASTHREGSSAAVDDRAGDDREAHRRARARDPR